MNPKKFILGIVLLFCLVGSGFALLTDGISAYYSLDNTINDSTLNLKHLTNNGATYNSTGKINGAYNFEGSSWYMNGSTGVLDVNTNISYSVWIYADTLKNGGVVGYRLDSGNFNWRYILVENTGNVVFYVRATNATILSPNINTTLSTKTWYHIVATLESSSTSVETARIYLNGVLQKEQVGNVGTFTSSTYGLGRDEGRNTDYFDGIIDEVGIWNRTLKQTEITSLYNGGLGFNPYNASIISINNILLNNQTLINNSYLSTNNAYFNLNLTNTSTNGNINTTAYLYNYTSGALITSYQVNNTIQPNFTFSSLANDDYNIFFYSLNNETSSISSNYTFVVNPNVYLYFNATGTMLSNFTINGTYYNSSYATIPLNILGGIGQNSILFNKSGYQTTTFTFNISNAGSLNFTFNVSNASINLNIYSKETLSLVTGVNFTIDIIGTITGLTTSTTNGTKNINTLLLTETNYKLVLSNANYTTEIYNFMVYNNETININMYVSNLSLSSLGSVFILTQGSGSEPLSNKIVSARQWDTTTNTFIQTSQATTGTDGKGVVNVIKNTKYYVFSAYNPETEEVLYSPSEIITDDESGVKIITLTFGETAQNIIYPENILIVNISENYNNVTNTSNIWVNWTTTNGDSVTGCINVYRSINYTTTLYGSEDCTTGAQVNKPASNFINSSIDIIIKVEFYINGVKQINPYAIYYYPATNSFNDVFKNNSFGVLLGIVLMILGLCAGIYFKNLYLSAISVIIISFVIALLMPSFVTIKTATLISIVSIMVIWGLYKRK